MSFLQSLLGGASKELAELEALFAKVPGGNAKYLACFSLLVAKIAIADNQVTEGERARIKDLLVERAELSPEEADVVCAAALKKSLVKSLDVKVICDALKTCANSERLKIAMLSCLFVASDEGISETEIQRIHSIARMLGFSFKQWQAILAEFNGEVPADTGAPENEAANEEGSEEAS